MISFDNITDRRNTNSYKWDSSSHPDMLPMWVADMDFKTAPAIIEALEDRVRHGIFGYTKVPEEYYDAVTGWFSSRHSWDINRDRIIYTSGVVPAISAIIKALTEPGEKVIIQTPVYNCFFSSIQNNGCIASESPLKQVGDTYQMDFEDLECRTSDPKAKIMLLCNPHNPIGRVWTREELYRVGEICRRHNVTVISDEIHCELVYPPYIYVPFASVSPEFKKTCVCCISPSKAFNIAGLQIANIVAEDKTTMLKIDKAININEVCDVNPFGVIATIAAYRHGAEWLEELINYIGKNYKILKNFFNKELPQFPVTRLEGTYLVWVDCRHLGILSEKIEERLCEEAHVWINAGSMYGNAGEGFIRINIACQRSRLLEGLQRLYKGLTALEDERNG